MKTIKAKVEVDTQEAGDKFTRLQTQIRETRTALQQASEAGDNLKFNQLKGQLDDLEDKLEVTSLKSKKFDDALAGLPGPAGAAGGALKGLDGMFKLLIANPVVAVIAGIAGALMAMKKSLESTAEGQEVLNRVSTAFSKILGPIMAIIESVAVPVFEGLASVLETVATGFNKFAQLLGISQEKIKETTKAAKDGMKEAVDEANKIIEKAELSLLNERQRKLKERELQFIEDKKKLQAAGITDLTTLEKAYQKDVDAINKEANDKAFKDQQGNIDKKKKIQEDANKILNEAELSLLSDRDRELRERDIRFEEEKKALKLAGVKDLSKFEAEYRKDVAAINKKFDDDEAKKAEDKAKKAEDDRKKGLEKALADEKLALDLKKSQGLLSEEEYQTALLEARKKYAVDNTALTQASIDQNNFARDTEKKNAEDAIKDLDAKLAANENDFNKERKLLDAKDAALKNSFDKKLISEADYNAQVAANAKAREQVDEAETAAKRTNAQKVAGILSGLSDLFGKETAAGKATAIAAATINTYLAASQALTGIKKMNPFGAAIAIAQAALIIATGIKNVIAITKVKVPGGGGGGGTTPSLSNPAAGGGGGSTATPAFTPNQVFGAPTVGATTAQTGTIAGIVAGAVNQNQSQTQPIRAYVVGNEVTTQQQLDRRISTAARLGG